MIGRFARQKKRVSLYFFVSRFLFIKFFYFSLFLFFWNNFYTKICFFSIEIFHEFVQNWSLVDVIELYKIEHQSLNGEVWVRRHGLNSYENNDGMASIEINIYNTQRFDTCGFSDDYSIISMSFIYTQQTIKTFASLSQRKLTSTSFLLLFRWYRYWLIRKPNNFQSGNRI